MGSIVVRMGVVIGVMIAAQMGFVLVGRMARPVMEGPQTPIEQFPMFVETREAGKWEGKEAELSKDMFDHSEAATVVSRIYSKEGQSLSFLLAEYDQPSSGLYHNPMNCYKSSGFELKDTEQLPLQVDNRADGTIRLSTWTRTVENLPEKILVAYWYEVGDYTMFERPDLLPTQWKMVGKAKWPMMFKVLLEMPAGDGEQSKTTLLNMAQYVRKWLGDDKVKPLVN
jgi:hypothetical protein